MINFVSPVGGQEYLSGSWIVHTNGQSQWGYAFPPSTTGKDGGSLLTRRFSSFKQDTIDTEGLCVGYENFIHHSHVNGDVSFGDYTTDFLADCNIQDEGSYYLWVEDTYSPRVNVRLPKFLFGNFQQNLGQWATSIGTLVGDGIQLSISTDNSYYGVLSGFVPGVLWAIADAEKRGLKRVFLGTFTLMNARGTRYLDYAFYITKVTTSVHISSSSGSLDMSDIFSHRAKLLLKDMDHVKGVDTFDLVQECYESLNYFDSNGIAFAKDLAEFRKLIPDPKVLLNLKSPRSWASLYLWLHYGISLTVKDSKALIRAFKAFISADSSVLKLKRQVRYASRTISSVFNGATIVTRYTVKLDCTPRDVGKAILLGDMFDTNLSLGNIWDLIPFSFMVDWFADISSKLERIDTYIESNAYYRLNSLVYGRRSEVTFDASQIMLGASGRVSFILYDREPRATLPPFRFPSTQSPSIQNHFIEAAAIIVAQKKH